LSNHETLRIRTLAPFQATRDGREVTFSSASAKALLGILALSEDNCESRLRLGALLWDDASDEQVRKRLRQTLYALRTSLGAARDAVSSNRDTIFLDPDMVSIDLHDVEGALQEGTVPQILLDPLDQGGIFLADLPERNSLFANWRTLRHRAVLNNLISALLDLRDGDDPHGAECAALALLSIDPSDEQTARGLIRSYARAGRIGQALRVYSDLWSFLDTEFDMEPSQPTQRLIADVKLGEIDLDTPTKQADAGPIRSVRLGFDPSDRHHDPEIQRKGDLFQSELIARLSRFREVEVVDLQVCPHAVTDFRMAQSLAPVDGQTRAALTLTQTSSGQVVWSRSFAGLSTEWQEKIFSIVDSLSTACNLGLSRARLSEIRKSGPAPRAFDHWLMGQMLLDDFRATSWAQAIDCFHDAIKSDPYFSGAWSSLAQVYNIRHLSHPGLLPVAADLARSRDLANRAITLDPEDSRAHLCRAWASLLVGQFEFAEVAFGDALDLNPNDPWTVISSALGAAFGGNIPTALDLAERTIKEKWSNLPSIWAYHATIRFLSGDYDQSVEAAENAGLAILNIPAWKAAALAKLGRLDDAAAAWGAFEEAALPAWASNEVPSTHGLLDWLRGSFPIRNLDDRDRFDQSVTAAAEHYLHCVQR